MGRATRSTCPVLDVSPERPPSSRDGQPARPSRARRMASRPNGKADPFGRRSSWRQGVARPVDNAPRPAGPERTAVRRREERCATGGARGPAVPVGRRTQIRLERRTMDTALRQKLADLPAEPGCYLMKDRQGEGVYVGKGSSLRARVRSYFGGLGGGGQAPALQAARGDERAFVALLDELLGDIDVIVTSSEKEAVLLENELIKKHQPRFNIRLRDDKDFIVLRLDERHAYPRLEVWRARPRKEDGARYFGPYSSASSIRETLRVVNRWFQLRTCTDHVFAHRKRPCILYQIHRCPAPCVYEVPAQDYRQAVEDAIAFLEGREVELVERLRRRMREAAQAQ